jgi:hypothetical protein
LIDKVLQRRRAQYRAAINKRVQGAGRLMCCVLMDLVSEG